LPSAYRDLYINTSRERMNYFPDEDAVFRAILQESAQ